MQANAAFIYTNRLIEKNDHAQKQVTIKHTLTHLVVGPLSTSTM